MMLRSQPALPTFAASAKQKAARTHTLRTKRHFAAIARKSVLGHPGNLICGQIDNQLVKTAHGDFGSSSGWELSDDVIRFVQKGQI